MNEIERKEYEREKELADKMVSRSVDKFKENGSFLLMLMGAVQFKLERRPGMGHDCNTILEAIYKYYSNNPNSGIEQMFSITLNTYAGCVASIEDLYKFMIYIYTQLENESKGIAPFTIDIKQILNTLKDHVMSAEKLSNDPAINNWLEQTDEVLKEKYGYRIL